MMIHSMKNRKHQAGTSVHMAACMTDVGSAIGRQRFHGKSGDTDTSSTDN